ncbi:MAG: hypothetical protein ABIK89_16900 [Planctomycetota bacterium]
MQGRLFPLRPRPAGTPVRPTSAGARWRQRSKSLRSVGLGLGCLVLLCCGCTTVAGPAPGSSQRLKELVNPLGAKAEEEAFKKKVENDPFPAASRSGIATGVIQNRGSRS